MFTPLLFCRRRLQRTALGFGMAFAQAAASTAVIYAHGGGGGGGHGGGGGMHGGGYGGGRMDGGGGRDDGMRGMDGGRGFDGGRGLDGDRGLDGGRGLDDGRGFRDFDGGRAMDGGARLDGGGRLDGAGGLDGVGRVDGARGLDGVGRADGLGRVDGAGRFAGDANLARAAAVGDRGIRPYSMNTLAARGDVVRNNFRGNAFYGNRGWYGNHFNRWWPGGWGFAGGMMAGFLWSDLFAWGGYGAYGGGAYGSGGGGAASTVPYDYGTTVVYQDDGVYVQGSRVGTAQEYAQQAATIATQGGATATIADDDEWRSLGVFAMTRSQETDASNFLSLAIDKEGILRGSYYNAVSDENAHVTGKVDKKTQRAAWTIGDKKEPVYEAGISNLTKDQLTILVHKAEGKVEQMLLVRVKEGVPGAGPVEKPGDTSAAQPAASGAK